MLRRSRHLFALILILTIGLGLRLYQLGEDSFWNDEAGQALAATEPTLREMIQVMQGHAMAMPLDYLVTRLISHAAVSEAVLRLPSVLWGTLAIALLYFLVVEITENRPVALISALILAISPIHIYYAQEMRFYSALLFFSLGSCLVLFKSLRSSRWYLWGLFVAVTGTGSFFHPYVLLTAINGLIYLLFFWDWKDTGFMRNCLRFSVSCGVLAAIFFAGFVFLHPQTNTNYDLLAFNRSIPEVIAQGLGWLWVSFCGAADPIRAWEVLNAGFALTGLGISVVHFKHHRKMAIVIIGALLQILFILGLDGLQGYWFVYRQIIHLAPIAMTLTALGIDGVGTTLGKLSSASSSLRLGELGLVVIFALTAYPRLAEMYRSVKSNSRDVVEAILDNHPAAGDTLLVIPGYEGKIYQFYLDRVYGRPVFDGRILSSGWDNLTSLEQPSGSVYLVVPAADVPGYADELSQLGYRPLYGPETTCIGSRAVFQK